MRFHEEEYQAVTSSDSDLALEVSSTSGEISSTQGTSTVAHQEAAARANMYRFLSAVYLSPVDEELLRQLVDHDFLDELSTMFGEQAVAELKGYASHASVDEDLQHLKQEYMDLFAVPTGRYVTPFEDVYRGGMADDEKGRGPLLGERAIAVTRTYRSAGAAMDRACKELPTHVGVELSFMSFLCEQEAVATCHEESDAATNREEKEPTESTRYRELQSRFLQEHLNQWFPQLSARIQARAGKPFYRGLAAVTEEFLSRDASGLLAQVREQSG
jgi:TorA maturation chaperone TorD